MDPTTEFSSRFDYKGEEGRTTRAIETRTSKVPSVVYLGLAVGSMVASAAIMAADQARPMRRRFAGYTTGHAGLANFIGQWAPTLLIIGLYNKVVKLERELVAFPK